MTEQQKIKSLRVVAGGAEATLHVTDKSILFEKSDGEVTGVERDAIRMVKTNSDNEVVVAYASGTEVKSIRIKPLDKEPADLLLMLEGKSRVVPPQVFDEEFERIYRYWKERLETQLKQNLEGNLQIFDDKEESELFNALITMDAIVEKRFNYSADDVPEWAVDRMPEEFQVAWAKYQYIVFLSHALIIATTKYTVEEHMYLDEWENVFLYYGIIDKPILPEEFKKKAREALTISVNDYQVKKYGPPPPGYKARFERKQ